MNCAPGAILSSFLAWTGLEKGSKEERKVAYFDSVKQGRQRMHPDYLICQNSKSESESVSYSVQFSSVTQSCPTFL